MIQETRADNDLMIDIQNGNVDSFKVLAERWQHRIFGHCIQLLSSRGLAEEATQEILLRVYRGAKGFRHEAQFSTWLFRITINCCNTIRHQNRHHSTETSFEDTPVLETQEDSLSNALEHLEQDERESEVHSALKVLKPDLKEVLLLRDLQELSYHQISAILNLPIGTVKSRINRARIALAQTMLAMRGAG